MKSRFTPLMALGMISILLFTLQSATATLVSTHDVMITTFDDTYSVEEKLTLQQHNATIQFTIHPQTTNPYVIINNTEYTPVLVSENLYTVNYSMYSPTNKTTLTISYSYPKTEDTQQFTKKFTYNTTTFTILLDQQTISSSKQVNADATITVQFPTQQDTVQSLNLFTIILIALLFILLIVTSVYGFKKRKNGNKRHRETESSELLTTEKSLLMNVLKDIEKKHRDHKISDETYDKLKTHYKQQTVDIMSNLQE